MIKSSDLQFDIDRLKKCVEALEGELGKLAANDKANCSLIGQKEKEKFDMLILIEAMEKKQQEVKAREIIQPITETQKRKQVEIELRNNTYSLVQNSYPSVRIDN